jgi:hypothetical protein
MIVVPLASLLLHAFFFIKIRLFNLECPGS